MASEAPGIAAGAGSELERRTSPNESNKSRWHFINFIFIPPDEEDRVQRPDAPPERWIPGAEPDNILQALEWCRVQLEGEGVSDADKAIALCWFLHLVGDVHQPLHTVALWSSEFPEGNRGGNEFSWMGHIA